MCEDSETFKSDAVQPQEIAANVDLCGSWDSLFSVTNYLLEFIFIFEVHLHADIDRIEKKICIKIYKEVYIYIFLFFNIFYCYFIINYDIFEA